MISLLGYQLRCPIIRVPPPEAGTFGGSRADAALQRIWSAVGGEGVAPRFDSADEAACVKALNTLLDAHKRMISSNVLGACGPILTELRQDVDVQDRATAQRSIERFEKMLSSLLNE
jgi:hypothetical protein